MAETAGLDRAGPLAGRLTASVTPLAPSVRLSLRGAAAALKGVESAFGVAPRDDVCRAEVVGDRAALWLGPDEWMLTAPGQDASALLASLAEALAPVPHSLVDISHRNTGFLVAGEGAATLLAEGCPLDLDLDNCPVGTCTRTVLGKCEVVLWRMAPNTFRIECWRSFAPYLSAFLTQAAENI
jgi:sarcosine oxidase, subunit gamma